MLAPGIYRTAEILPNRPTSTAPPAQPQGANGSVTQQPEGPAPLTTLAISRGPAPSWATSSQCHSSPRPSGALSRHPCPLGCWDPHPAPGRRLLACNSHGHALHLGGGLAPLPSRSGTGWRPPQHPKQDDKQKETDQDGGQPPAQAAGGRGGRGRGGRKERAGMQLGTNLLLLYQSLSQSTGVC